MYDVLFVDVPNLDYHQDIKMDDSIRKYRKRCEQIVEHVTGVSVNEKDLYYSMGILSISAYLKHHIEKIEIGYLHYHLDMEQFDEMVRGSRVVAFSCMTVTINTILQLARRAVSVNKNVHIVLGGYHATYLAREILEKYNFIECVFRKEGEKAWLDYMSGKKKSQIEGLVYRNRKGTIVENAFGKCMDMEKIPIPDYSLLGERIRKFNLQLSTMRGCTGGCDFCVNRSYWGGVRLRPVEMIGEELRVLSEIFPKGTVIHIIDNVFTISKKRLQALVFEIKRRKLENYFWFECDARAEMIDCETVELLCKLHVFKVCLGIEDCKREILDLSNKQQDYNDCLSAAESIKKFSKGKICVYAYWIIGLPGTSRESIEENIDEMKKALRRRIFQIISVKIFIPYPGTEIFEHWRKYNLTNISENWNAYERRMPPYPYQYENIGGNELYNGLLKAFEACEAVYEELY